MDTPTIGLHPAADTTLKTRVILVGVGGASCSGKTTLAKHLRRILPNSIIIHQDDFAPLQKLIPIHPILGVHDWDAAEGAINWPRLVSFLQRVKDTGEIPPDHRSHDHLNDQNDIPIGDDVYQRLRDTFSQLETQMKDRGERIVWRLVDGFLLYWDKNVIDQLDVRIFLRVPHDTLQKRRHERHGYHTAVQSDYPEESLWRDPPNYFEYIVYPAYILAHAELFEDADVESGKLTGKKVENLVLIEGLEMAMSDVVEKCCKILIDEVKR